MTNIFKDVKMLLSSGMYDGNVMKKDRAAIRNYKNREIKEFFVGVNYDFVKDPKRGYYDSHDYCDFFVKPTNFTIDTMNNRLLVLANGTFTLFEVSKYEGMLITSTTTIGYRSIDGEDSLADGLEEKASRETNIYSSDDSKRFLEECCNKYFSSEPYAAHNVIFLANENISPIATAGASVRITRNANRLIDTIEYSCNRDGEITDGDIYMDGRATHDPLIKITSDLAYRDKKAMTKHLLISTKN